MDDCVICDRIQNKAEQMILLSSALFNKYSQSQNYIYQQKITDLMESNQNKFIELNDKMIFEENYERLNRVYFSSEWIKKIEKLSEYYKFHKEIPRLFLKKLTKVYNEYHNKQRKIKYCKIKRMMGEKVQISDDDDELPNEKPQTFKSTQILKDIDNHIFQKSINLNEFFEQLETSKLSQFSIQDEFSLTEPDFKVEIEQQDAQSTQVKHKDNLQKNHQMQLFQYNTIQITDLNIPMLQKTKNKQYKIQNKENQIQENYQNKFSIIKKEDRPRIKSIKNKKPNELVQNNILSKSKQEQSIKFQIRQFKIQTDRDKQIEIQKPQSFNDQTSQYMHKTRIIENKIKQINKDQFLKFIPTFIISNTSLVQKGLSAYNIAQNQIKKSQKLIFQNQKQQFLNDQQLNLLLKEQLTVSQTQRAKNIIPSSLKVNYLNQKLDIIRKFENSHRKIVHNNLQIQGLKKQFQMGQTNKMAVFRGDFDNRAENKQILLATERINNSRQNKSVKIRQTTQL